ncbi:m7GpppN-mRNA hydrolase-like [Paramacrobiotus metropolitanus]|uniref:m7GpppN-mRNA hydrolase-like n=1 Tax=Paramacrobiotus metropolitanus TaxID=2943436 RepID=UPI002445F7BE|nr:m7GpppN-mRNA hydrolase-like [Paramacrobiotus metropolitanus]
MLINGIPDTILDDSLMRFLLELDSEEMKDFVRVFFKIEEAHWFYLDHYCDNNPLLPRVGTREFCEIACRHVPFLHKFVEYLDDHWKAWKQYKANIPTAGAILLDETLDYVLVLENFNRRFGFPKGKKNNNETMQECAVREVLEETGYDISDKITPDEYLELSCDDMFVQLFIVHGVSKDTAFSPMTRGEVKALEWMPVKDLPGATGPQTTANSKYKAQAYFMIRPFINPLKRWIEMNRRVILGTPSPSSQESPQHQAAPSSTASRKILEVPLSVQKHAAFGQKSPRHSGPESMIPPTAELDDADGTVPVYTSPSKMRYPFIEFEDFVPQAWKPGSIKIDPSVLRNGY